MEWQKSWDLWKQNEGEGSTSGAETIGIAMRQLTRPACMFSVGSRQRRYSESIPLKKKGQADPLSTPLRVGSIQL